MQGKLGRVITSPLFVVVVLLAGISANTAVSVHYDHKYADEIGRTIDANNAATLKRARLLYRLRQYTDDGIHDIDTIIRSYAPEHPGVILPPPLEPEPSYESDPTLAPAAQP